MTVRRYLLALIVSCSGACGGIRLQGSLPLPPEGEAIEYDQPQPQQWTLGNGLTVVYIADDEIPVIRGSLYLPGGSLGEPPDLPGIVSVMGAQMRQGGAAEMDADELDLELEKLSAAIASDYGAEFGTVSFSCLSHDFERVLGIVSDVVLEPRFQQDRIDLWKGQALESIRRRVDDPSAVANIAFKQLVFGSSPLGRVMTDEDVQRIRRLDLLRMHRTMVKPRGAFLAITGKIERDRLEALVNTHFGAWQGSYETAADPAIDYKPVPGLYFIELPFSQSTVYMGHQGPPRLSPDYIEIEGFNSVFGSGDFGSRMMKKIRSELGLAYVVYGGVIAGYPIGQSIVVLQTKSESTVPAVVESLNILRDIKQNSVSAEELEQAKKSIENSFVFRLDTSDDLVRRVVLLKLLDYPADYDATYLDRVRQMNKAQVQAVARERWRIDEMVVVVVGDKSAYNSVKQHLEVESDGIGSLPLRRCEFKQQLGACQ